MTPIVLTYSSVDFSGDPKGGRSHAGVAGSGSRGSTGHGGRQLLRLAGTDVSICVARMQSLLREIGSAWMADQSGDTGHGTVMLLVPDREQHTLGPMVAMGQMRRYGVSVCLRIAPNFNELRSLLAARKFDGILISVATRDKLESVAATVKFLKSIMAAPCPIVLGGAVMSEVMDPASCTGADFSSNDIGAAHEAIGLKFDASCVLRRA